MRGCRAYCMRWRKVTKVTNPILDFTFLSTAKSGKSRLKNPFLDSPKGTQPNFAILIQLHYCPINNNQYISIKWRLMNRGNTNINEDMIVPVVIGFHSRLHATAEHQDCPVFTVFLTIKTSPKNISITFLQIFLKL